MTNVVSVIPSIAVLAQGVIGQPAIATGCADVNDPLRRPTISVESRA
jgi:hypothetical protein